MNPFDFQKQVLEEWEKNLARYLDETMRQPEFMKLVGKSLETSMDLQGAIKRGVQASLKALSIPTHGELEGLYRTVNDLESRMLDLEERLEDLAEAGGRPGPEAPGAVQATPAPDPSPAPERATPPGPEPKARSARKAAPARRRSRAVQR